MRPVVYLAGSIRDGNAEDILWREHAIDVLQDVADIISPLAGKRFDPTSGKWSLYGTEVPDAKYIVHADFWAVDRADIILFDFRSLADGYPSVGTLTEFGRSTARNVLRLAIIAPTYAGHESQRRFVGLHPFLEQNVAKTFGGPKDAIGFVFRYCVAISGGSRYSGEMDT